jgi:hypothetical protein
MQLKRLDSGFAPPLKLRRHAVAGMTESAVPMRPLLLRIVAKKCITLIHREISAFLLD